MNAHIDLLKQAEDRIAELEGDLADQRDVIENLIQDRDHDRMEVTRLEFTLSKMVTYKMIYNNNNY